MLKSSWNLWYMNAETSTYGTNVYAQLTNLFIVFMCTQTELTCPGDQVYDACSSICNQSCRSLSMPDIKCDSVCEEGCFCPRGLYLSDTGLCVPPDQCTCHYDGEIYQPNDMFADHHSIWSVMKTSGQFWLVFAYLCFWFLNCVFTVIVRMAQCAAVWVISHSLR